MKDNLKYLKLNLFLFLLLIISTLLFSVDVSAANREMFCSQEEIQNFEEAGYDKNAVLYFKSDKVYSVYSSFNDAIYFNDENYIFSIDNNYMTIGHIGEDGFRHVDGYGKEFRMFDYKDSCILKVNDNIPVKNKTEVFITDEGVKIVNDYSDCLDNAQNKVIGNLCALMVFSSDMVNASFSSPFLVTLFGLFVASSSLVIIYIVSEVFKKR